MIVKDFLGNKNNIIKKEGDFILRKHYICKDGFRISIQASKIHNCSPRQNLYNGEYTKVEVACLPQDELNEYKGENMYYEVVYDFVPIELIEKLIEKHNKGN